MYKTFSKKALLTFSVIVLAYFISQLFIINYVPLAADEFWFAHHIFQYTHKIPYRDFIPYKTTLGYYLLSPPFFLSHDIIKPLFWIKYQMNVFNTASIGILMLWLNKYYDYKSIALAIILCITCSLFLRHFNELRVDALTTWVGVFALVFFLEKKYWLAGIMAGFSFLISQKGLYFIVAINIVFVINAIIYQDLHQRIISAIRFNISCFFLVFIYVVFFAWQSSFKEVIYSVFFEPFLLASLDLWEEIRWRFWVVYTRENPLLFMLIAMSFFFINPENERSLNISLFAFLFLMFSILNTQPWPYSIAIMVPIMMIALTDFINSMHLNAQALNILLLIYALGIMVQINSMRYYYKRSNKYQVANVKLLDKVVTDKQGYFAGIPFLYNRDQSAEGLRNLIRPSVRYFYKHESKYIPGLFASLLNKPTTASQAIRQIENKNVYFYQDSYRILNLPKKIRNVLGAQFFHVWGGLYTKGDPKRIIKANKELLDPKYQKDCPLCMAQMIL